MPKPFSLRVMEAVMDSSLPKDVRHLLHAMAVSGNSKTGTGWLSHRTLADRTGLSIRNVGGILRKLQRADSTPVRVESQPRFRSEGRGRTSNRWKLVLTNRHAVPVEESTKRQGVPVEDDGLNGKPGRTKRQTTTDQPAPGADHDLGSDLGSELGSSAKPPSKQKKGTSQKRTRLKIAVADPRVKEVVVHFRDRAKPHRAWDETAKVGNTPRVVCVLNCLERGFSVQDIKNATEYVVARENDPNRRTGNGDLELICREAKTETYLGQASNGKGHQMASPSPSNNFDAKESQRNATRLLEACS